MSVLGTHLYQCTSWHCCERLWSASVNFFEDSTHLPISWWVIYKHPCPDCTECSAVFDQKWHDPSVLPSLFTWSLSKGLCFVSLDEKNPQRETFCHVEEVKQKTAEALKGIKIDEFKNCFEQWEKMSRWVYSIKWRVLWRWLKFKHVRINIQFFK